jgi:hypothetical protein
MAADYIEQIKTVQLREDGDNVALIVGDAYPPPRLDAEAGDPGRRAPDPEEERTRALDLIRREAGLSGASFWEDYVSGHITESHLPCSHMDLLLPEMLGKAWSAVSAWLGLDASRE